jgi:hypothetical protein
MTATNDFLPFATGAGANVLTPANFNPTPQRQTGFQAGVAISAQMNTVWRQSQFVGAMITQFIVDTLAQSVADDGNLSGLEAQFIAAIQAAVGGPPQSALWHFGHDTGVANAMTIPVLTPAITSYADGMVISTIVAATNTIPNPTISIMGLATVAIVHGDMSALAPGDIQAGNVVVMQYDAANRYYRLLWQVPIPQQALVHFGADTGAANAMIVGAVTPTIASLITGMLFEIKKGNAGNTGSLSLQILNTICPVTWPDGTGMIGGEWPAGAIGLVTYDATAGGRFNLVGDPKAPAVAYNYVHNGADVGSVNNIVSNMFPPITQYNPGHLYIITNVAATNSGPMTANFNGVGPRQITDNQNNPLLANQVLAGQMLHLIDNGQNLCIPSRTLNVFTSQVFTSSGTYTPTPGRKIALAFATGGGGAGCGGVIDFTCTSGGSGATAIAVFSLVGLGPQLVTIGKGGPSVPGYTSGPNGGTTTVGTLLSAGGGEGGAYGAGGGNGGIATVGNVALIPGNSGFTIQITVDVGFMGAASFWGGSGNLNVGGYARSGLNGAYGGGGAFSSAARPSGAGGDGFVWILEF